jgi:hypothetical protein
MFRSPLIVSAAQLSRGSRPWLAGQAASAGAARLEPRLGAEARAEERLRDHLARLGPVPSLDVI